MNTFMNKNVNYNNPELYNHYKNQIMSELPKYRYDEDNYYTPTETGVEKILDVYFSNKGWLYPLFEKHPLYKGNGQIVFSADYHRKVNKVGVCDFCVWANDALLDLYEKKSPRVLGMTYTELDTYYHKLDNIVDSMYYIKMNNIGQSRCEVRVNGKTFEEMKREKIRIYDLKREIRHNLYEVCSYHKSVFLCREDSMKANAIMNIFGFISDNPVSIATEKIASVINNFGDMAGLNIRAVAGQKMSRIIGKICRMVGLDKNPKYGNRIAQLGDDINEMLIKRHTIISINPWDYFSMSFGKSWSNCSTIDKMNDRHINSNGGHIYKGDSGSGTISYLCDPSTIVYYMVEESYKGDEYELQPKTHRCLFHIGEDKMIQGRVYPKSNDGDNTIYEEIRAIMQKVMSEIFEVNNLWTYKQGHSACKAVTETYGTHYADYIEYDCCTVCWHNNGTQVYKNNKPIIIGHNPICINCGKEHKEYAYIQCEWCR